MQFLLTLFHCKALQAKMSLIFIWRNLFQWQSSLRAAICQSICFFFLLLKQAWESCKTNATQGRAEGSSLPTLICRQLKTRKHKGSNWRESPRYKVKENSCMSLAFIPNTGKAFGSHHLSTFPRANIIWDYAGRVEYNIYNKKHVFLKRQWEWGAWCFWVATPGLPELSSLWPLK